MGLLKVDKNLHVMTCLKCLVAIQFTLSNREDLDQLVLRVREYFNEKLTVRPEL